MDVHTYNKSSIRSTGNSMTQNSCLVSFHYFTLFIFSFAPSIGSKNTPNASEHASAKFLKKGQQKSADSKDSIEQQSTRNFYGTNSAPPIASKFLTRLVGNMMSVHLTQFFHFQDHRNV